MITENMVFDQCSVRVYYNFKRVRTIHMFLVILLKAYRSHYSFTAVKNNPISSIIYIFHD